MPGTKSPTPGIVHNGREDGTKNQRANLHTVKENGFPQVGG